MFFLNVYSSKVSYLAILIAGGELFLILVYILKKNYQRALAVVIISVTTSLEVSSFVFSGTSRPLYSIYNLPIVSVYPFYLLLFALFLLTYSKYVASFTRAISKQKNLRRLVRYLPTMFFSGFLIGIIAGIFNDNGVANTSWYFTGLFTQSFRYLAMISFIGTAVILVVAVPRFYEYLASICESLLISAFFAATITVLIGWHGYYGQLSNLMLMPLAVSLCPLLIVFPVFNTTKSKIAYMAMGILFTLESFYMNSLMGSKFYIIPILALVVYFVVAVKKKSIQILLFSILLLIGFLIYAEPIMNMIMGDEYGSWKLSQLLGMFNLSGNSVSGWYSNLEASPRFRIDELVNIAIEYMEKPWCFLFGKGNIGTITHHWGTTNWNNRNGTFSDYQIDSGIFWSMHESFNILFIRHGLLGLVFIGDMVYSIVKRLFKSPWTIAALIWLLFYWNIYYSWWIGAIAMILCLYDHGQNREKNC